MDKKETDLLFSSLLNFAGSDTPNDAEHVTATGLSLYVIKKYLLEGKDPREFLEGIADQTGQEAETMDGSANDAADLLDEGADKLRGATPTPDAAATPAADGQPLEIVVATPAP